MNILSHVLAFFTTIFVTFYPQKTYTEGLVGQPKSFYPSIITSENDRTISKLLYRGLFAYDKYGTLTEDLADSYDISDDGLEYTVYLKKDQKWSNGSEITADDLLYSAFSDPQLKEIATDKINKYTIRYILPNKFSPFPTVLTQGVVPASPQPEGLKKDSSGPFKIVRIKNEGPIIKEVTLQAIDNAYSTPRIAFRYYENEEQLFTAFKLGEIDGFVSSETLTHKNLEKLVLPLRGIYYSLIFNTRIEKLSKPDIRKKLVKATPVKHISSLKGLEVKGPLSESKYNNQQVRFDEFSESYTDNLNIMLKLTLPNSPEYAEIGQIIKNSWSRIGVIVDLIKKSSEDIEQNVVATRDFEVLLYGQEISRDPDRYSVWHSTRADAPGLNLSGFGNVRLDRSLEEGRYAVEEENRRKHYDIFQDVIFENAPAIFLYHPVQKFYHSDKVVVPEDSISLTYYPYDRFIDFKNWEVR